MLLMALWGSPHKAAAQIFAVRANALAACTATLNLGVEVALTDRWSLEGALFWNPVRTEDLATSFRAAQLGARYWFYETQVGPFVGAQLSHVNYLVGRRTRRSDARTGTTNISTTRDAGPWSLPAWRCRLPICFSHESTTNDSGRHACRRDVRRDGLLGGHSRGRSWRRSARFPNATDGYTLTLWLRFRSSCWAAAAAWSSRLCCTSPTEPFRWRIW